MNGPVCKRRQKGAATLLTALALMTSITVVTLAVARSQLNEQRILNNAVWVTRLTLEARAGVAEAIDHVGTHHPGLTWSTAGKQTHLQHTIALPSKNTGVDRTLQLFRETALDPYLKIVATASRQDGSGLDAVVSQYVRPLSVLTPFAEDAPPLILGGCPRGVPHDLHVRPRNSDTPAADTAVLLARRHACTMPANSHLHGGRMRYAPLPADLWSVLFSVSRRTFETLSDSQRQLPPARRRYWQVKDPDLTAGKWTQSLGQPQQPVVLYFPAKIGCPQFAPGVRLYGLIFIESACQAGVATHSATLYGVLAISAALDTTGSEIHISHISLAQTAPARLLLPTLRIVRIPGTWVDF